MKEEFTVDKEYVRALFNDSCAYEHFKCSMRYLSKMFIQLYNQNSDLQKNKSLEKLIKKFEGLVE